MVVSCDQPVNIRCPCVPIATRVLVRGVGLITSRANYRFVAQQMANAACLRIFAAGTVVPASYLDCLPLRKGLQQVADESRLAYLRCETTDCYYGWKIHFLHDGRSRQQYRLSL